MPDRQASVFVCDEVLVSLTGKFNVLGMYTGDIAIFGGEAPSPQLVFVFQIECDLTDPYRLLIAQVTLPGEGPRQMPVPFAIPSPSPESRTRWITRWPFLVPIPTLRPGRVEAKVIHERGEIIAGYQWIVSVPRPQVDAPPVTVSH
jgi:hypothetical protein